MPKHIKFELTRGGSIYVRMTISLGVWLELRETERKIVTRYFDTLVRNDKYNLAKAYGPRIDQNSNTIWISWDFPITMIDEFLKKYGNQSYADTSELLRNGTKK